MNPSHCEIHLSPSDVRFNPITPSSSALRHIYLVVVGGRCGILPHHISRMRHLSPRLSVFRSPPPTGHSPRILSNLAPGTMISSYVSSAVLRNRSSHNDLHLPLIHVVARLQIINRAAPSENPYSHSHFHCSRRPLPHSSPIEVFLPGEKYSYNGIPRPIRAHRCRR